jgi:hypothetical protein
MSTSDKGIHYCHPRKPPRFLDHTFAKLSRDHNYSQSIKFSISKLARLTARNRVRRSYAYLWRGNELYEQATTPNFFQERAYANQLSDFDYNFPDGNDYPYGEFSNSSDSYFDLTANGAATRLTLTDSDG